MGGRYDEYFDPEEGPDVDLGPPKKRTTTVISLRLKPDDVDRLQAIASARGETVGGLARTFIREGIETAADDRRPAPHTDGEHGSVIARARTQHRFRPLGPRRADPDPHFRFPRPATQWRQLADPGRQGEPR